MVQEKQGKLLSPGKKGMSGNIFFLEGILPPNGQKFQGLSLSSSIGPKSLLTWFATLVYTVYTLLHINQALLKGSIEPQLLSLFLTLQSLLDKRKHPLFATHIQSHAGFPGPMAEGNSQADALVSLADTFQSVVMSHQFFYQTVMPHIENLTFHGPK